VVERWCCRVTNETCDDGTALNPRLKGEHIVIVGGSSGVGLALAARCARAGARLTLLARDIAKLREAASRLGGDAQVRTVDLRRPETISPAVEELGALDHLVITAGSFRPAVLGASRADDCDCRSTRTKRTIAFVAARITMTALS
jgi:NADP-dependent 3-hydroxy acid dehydrogenase YdfG